MTRFVLIAMMASLLVSGLEGAVDAVRVVHTDDESAPHDRHADLIGEPSDPALPDTDPDSHFCHCGVHVPPLAFALTASLAEPVREILPAAHTLQGYLRGPPPLPPPIV